MTDSDWNGVVVLRLDGFPGSPELLISLKKRGIAGLEEILPLVPEHVNEAMSLVNALIPIADELQKDGFDYEMSGKVYLAISLILITAGKLVPAAIGSNNAGLAFKRAGLAEQALSVYEQTHDLLMQPAQSVDEDEERVLQLANLLLNTAILSNERRENVKTAILTEWIGMILDGKWVDQEGQGPVWRRIYDEWRKLA
jgi:hypothetical protein